MRASAARAAFTIVAVIGSFLALYAIGIPLHAGTPPAILAAILALTLSRRPARLGGLRVVTYPLSLAAIGIVAIGVGHLLVTLPLAGAIVFVAAMFASIYLRDYGERGRTIGGLVALPLVAMLITPAPHAPGGTIVDLALTVCAGLVASLCVGAAQGTARRLHLVPFIEVEATSRTPRSDASTSANASATRMPVATRMALQMAVALALAFAAGFALFPGHWSWTVLTAFIVCSGAIGRGDAAYKGLLRLLGAASGTAVAAFATHVWSPSGPAEAIAIFAMLYLGVWLREASYAYWAACMTLVLALVAGNAGLSTSALLGVRLEAIVAGAVCAVAATWFVYPIRTRDVIRRRLADALLALDEWIVALEAPRDERALKRANFERRIADLERVAHPVRLHRRLLTIADHPEHPGRWLDLARRCGTHARGLDDAMLPAQARGALRRAIGNARRAIGAYGKPDVPPAERAVTAALQRVHDALARMHG
jgi:uncharacterized membrane protein YccC